MTTISAWETINGSHQPKKSQIPLGAMDHYTCTGTLVTQDTWI